MPRMTRGFSTANAVVVIGAAVLVLLIAAIVTSALLGGAGGTAPGPRAIGYGAGSHTLDGSRHLYIFQPRHWIYAVIDDAGNAQALLVGIDVPAVTPQRLVDGKLMVPVKPGFDLPVPLEDPELIRVITPRDVRAIKSPATRLQLARFMEIAVDPGIPGLDLAQITDEAVVFEVLARYAAQVRAE